MHKTLFLISLALSSAACSDADADREKTGVAQAVVPSQQGAPAPDAAEARPFALTDNDQKDGGAREFSYSWPTEVSREPDLVRQFKARMAEELASQKRDWLGVMADCPADTVSCRNNTLEVEWKVVADLPRFLSLSSYTATYSGGAHGSYGRSALVWDREAGTSLDPKDMFELTALEKATASSRCRLLNAERAERRGAPVPVDSSEWSEDCPDMDAIILFVGSSSRRAFDRLGFYYGPYVAGSYAEGEYEVDLPVNAAILAAVKPQYRAAFAVKR
ncbi:MAG: PdaC/SigV domain-containing protein [Novosphingobium sp.]